MNKKHTASYLIGLSGITLALAFMILPNNNNVLAQQNSTNTGGGSGGNNNKTLTITLPPTRQQQNPYTMSGTSQNWTGSISLFSPIIDAFKSKVHTTLNDATSNAIKAVGGGSNSSAVAAFIHPERGFLVYNVFVLDSSNNIHRVLVDPGNGKVLSSQAISLMDVMSMMHPSTGMGTMMGGPSGMMMGPLNGMMMPHGMMDHGMGMMGPTQNMMGMMMPHGMMDHGMGMMGHENNPWP
jgi:hypothetical protein